MRQAGEDGYVQMSAAIEDLNHPIGPGEFFHVPAGFIGLYHGDWDEAGYRTQRFTEAALAPPVPDDNFPYVIWDSWRYQQSLDESTLKMEAQLAAPGLSVQLQYLDVLGPKDIETAFRAATKGRADAVLPLPGPMFNSQRTHVVELVAKSRRPAILPS